MHLVSVKQLSGLGKAAIGAILTFGALLQVPAFSAAVFHLANLHPHIAALIGVLTTLAALMSNPQVQRILHIQPGVTLAAQNVAMDASGIITAESATLKGPKV
jgi:hypothetical protein